MYCVKCGVGLADTERVCPLCGTKVCFPEATFESEPFYPEGKTPEKGKNRFFIQLAIAILFGVAAITVLFSDLTAGGGVTWSAYVMGSAAVLYVCLFLPFWFERPNPVIFVPCGFAAVALFLMLVSFMTKGGWFLTFALPVTAGICLIVTAVVALTKYLKKGRLYVFGGAGVALAAFMPIIELLSVLTFSGTRLVGWSFYPFVALALIGGWLIFLAIHRPAREAMERIFFI